MSQYAVLDALILAVAKDGFESGAWVSKDVVIESRRIARDTYRHPSRVTDGRLQSLRKRGLIAYTPRGGWKLSKGGAA